VVTTLPEAARRIEHDRDHEVPTATAVTVTLVATSVETAEIGIMIANEIVEIGEIPVKETTGTVENGTVGTTGTRIETADTVGIMTRGAEY
jgi:hypothetical protein